MLRLAENNVQDYSVFNDQSFQYALYEAQKNYVRFGSDETMSKLTALVVRRVKCNDYMHLKYAIDRALSIVGLFSLLLN